MANCTDKHGHRFFTRFFVLFPSSLAKVLTLQTKYSGTNNFGAHLAQHSHLQTHTRTHTHRAHTHHAPTHLRSKCTRRAEKKLSNCKIEPWEPEAKFSKKPTRSTLNILMKSHKIQIFRPTSNYPNKADTFLRASSEIFVATLLHFTTVLH